MSIDPKSPAGILLRELDTPEQALHYAKGIADSGGPLAQEYASTAAVLQRLIQERREGHHHARALSA